MMPNFFLEGLDLQACVEICVKVWCPGRDSNSHACWARDFESLVSTISPPGQRFENSINVKLKLQLI